MKPVDNSISMLNISNEDFKNVRKTNTDSLPKDSVEISNTAKVYDRID